MVDRILRWGALGTETGIDGAAHWSVVSSNPSVTPSRHWSFQRHRLGECGAVDIQAATAGDAG
jgi:hypothetical protein